MSTLDLFADEQPTGAESIGPQSVVLRGHALPHAAQLLEAVEGIAARAPLRHLVTPGGFTMSVAMTNCGELGWATNERGYVYAPNDPTTGRPWPPMPAVFQALCHEAAVAADYPDFRPDACLINRYAVGAKLSLHQDKDEPDLRAPIVSVSLGLPAVFQFGGLRRNDPLKRIMLEHGDVVVWGRESRLYYHGIQPLKPGVHPLTGEYRFNLTFRQAGYSKLK